MKQNNIKVLFAKFVIVFLSASLLAFLSIALFGASIKDGIIYSFTTTFGLIIFGNIFAWAIRVIDVKVKP